ncbi:MAG: recombination protein O N-terminal domain-containing protein [Patescibacteria group bacterium]|nr:recombination protein O N-terminal domain-containing protein [Patescibacteria group bacterium]MDE2172518.1 recombination protein O N-terminal domain-containing protein [Patescibacteria group bacterium]
MHHIHTTPGFVIDSHPYGEAGKMLSIFTRDFGLVLATAQGIRLEKSKLRYHTQEYAFGVFSFVRGKEFWRLTHAEDSKSEGIGTVENRGVENKVIEEDKNERIQNGEYRIESRMAQELIGRIAVLLRRLLHGEESQPRLFMAIESARDFLQRERALTADQFKALESVIVLRILDALGYIGNDRLIEARFRTEPLTPGFLAELAPERMRMNVHINKALRESQL